jgi:hypothetical protein
MTDEMQSVNVKNMRLNVPEDNMYEGSIFCQDLLAHPIGKFKCTRENYSEKSLEIQFGIIPAKDTTI